MNPAAPGLFERNCKDRRTVSLEALAKNWILPIYAGSLWPVIESWQYIKYPLPIQERTIQGLPKSHNRKSRMITDYVWARKRMAQEQLVTIHKRLEKPKADPLFPLPGKKSKKNRPKRLVGSEYKGKDATLFVSA